MNEKQLDKSILDIISSFGPISVQEISYVIKSNIIHSSALLLEELASINHHKILGSLRRLIKEKVVKQFRCNSGYENRYGFPDLPLTTNLDLKIELVQCQECPSWLIKYSDQYKHISSFFCSFRDNDSQKLVLYRNYDDVFFIIYNSLFLGVFDNGLIRLPGQDRRKEKPEIIVVSDIIKKKKHHGNIFENLKFNFKEVICYV